LTAVHVCFPYLIVDFQNWGDELEAGGLDQSSSIRKTSTALAPSRQANALSPLGPSWVKFSTAQAAVIQRPKKQVRFL
jgi:hypothetical protein